MWTFPIILCISFLTAFFSTMIVAVVSPEFWRWSVTHAYILIAVHTTPEIETPVYLAFFAISVILFFLFFQFAKHVRHDRTFVRSVAAVNYTFALYLLVASTMNVFTIYRVQPVLFVCCVVVGIAASTLTNLSPYILEGIVAAALLRFSINPMVELDRGNHLLYTFDNYLRYVVPFMATATTLGIAFLLHRRIAFFRTVTGWVTKKWVIVALAACFIISLFYLMIKSALPSDMFFTMLPAYEITHGRTLLVSTISQYGLLYLAPWIGWFLIAPRAPVSFHVGVVVSAVLLGIYFIIYMGVVSALIRRRFFFVVTAIASFYFTILVRYTRLSDMVSVVSTPAFTPLRFGMFIIPLWFLVRFCKTGNIRQMTYFVIASAILFFFSFEIGVGLVAAAIATVAIFTLLRIHPRNFLLSLTVWFIGTLTASALILILYTQLSAHTFPNFSLYWQIALLYGSGFLTTPMTDQTIGFVPVIIALIGFLIGFVQVVREKKREGLILCYLAFTEFVLFPYYTGRSMNQTIYSIILPVILLCVLLIEEGIAALRKDRFRLAPWAMIIVCGMVLVIGFMRGIGVLAQNVIRAPQITKRAVIYIDNAFTTWDIRNSRQYAFLSRFMPKGCPLLSFDKNEFELAPVLGVPPAFQYPFIYGFITSGEQVDTLTPPKDARNVCIFVSQQFIAKEDPFIYGTYRYFFRKYQQNMLTIATDNSHGFTLYSLPTSVFDRH